MGPKCVSKASRPCSDTFLTVHIPTFLYIFHEMFFTTCYNWDASTARYTRFRPHETLHRFRNNATVDVNANSAVNVFGTHTHTNKQQYAMEQRGRVSWGLKRV